MLWYVLYKIILFFCLKSGYCCCYNSAQDNKQLMNNNNVLYIVCFFCTFLQNEELPQIKKKDGKKETSTNWIVVTSVNVCVLWASSEFACWVSFFRYLISGAGICIEKQSRSSILNEVYFIQDLLNFQVKAWSWIQTLPHGTEVKFHRHLHKINSFKVRC